jgi:glycine/D-amino acid oxidase-like deaminating enzyme
MRRQENATARRKINGNAHRVVIVGAGFGGLNAAQALASAPVSITVIDRKNHHTFQPLLYQVATAGLSPGEIAAPIRSILQPSQERRSAHGRSHRLRSRAPQWCKRPTAKRTSGNSLRFAHRRRRRQPRLFRPRRVGSVSLPASKPSKTPSKSAAAFCSPSNSPNAAPPPAKAMIP